MTFINEYISEEDWAKYNFDSIDKRMNYNRGQKDWTINRAKDIWLRDYYTPIDRDDGGRVIGPNEWDFYWKGTLMVLKTNFINYWTIPEDGVYATYMSIHERIVSLNIPVSLQIQKEEILEDAASLLKYHLGVNSLFRPPNPECEVDVQVDWEGITF